MLRFHFLCRHLLAGLVLVLTLALPALAETTPPPVTVILTPGQSAAEIEETLRAAAKAGGSVTVEWRDAAAQASGETTTPAGAGVAAPAPASGGAATH